MNRDIKFRGKRLDNGEWVYGYYVFSSGHHLIHEGDGVSFGIWTVDPRTVGQFTDVKDGNQQEVYEGDIVRDAIYGGGSKLIMWACWGFCEQNENGILHVLTTDVKRLEVIGNIHDNPELLTEKVTPCP